MYVCISHCHISYSRVHILASNITCMLKYISFIAPRTNIAVLHRCIRNGSHIIRAVKEHSIVMSKICLASFGMFLIVSNAACICSAFVPNQLTLTNTLSTGRGNILLLSADATSASNSASDELFHRSLLEHRLKNQRMRGGRPPNATAEKKRKVANRNANTIYVGNLSYGELSSTVDGPIQGYLLLRRSCYLSHYICGSFVFFLSDATEEQIRELFEPHGSITRVFMPMDQGTGKFRGFAFLAMSSRYEMERACEAVHQTSFLGRRIFANESVPKDRQSKEQAATKLYVGNLSFDTTKEEVAEYFGQFGSVREVYIPMDNESGLPKGFGFVQVDGTDSERAINGANGQYLNGRRLDVSLSLPRGQRAPRRKKVEQDSVKLYVGNLSFSSTVESILSIFLEYGEVTDCYMPVERETGSSRGFAFVTMGPDDAMRAADEMDGYELDGRVLRVNEALPKVSSREAAELAAELDADE